MRWGQTLSQHRNLRRGPGTGLIVMAGVLIMVLVFAPGAWGASRYRTLYKFSGGSDGDQVASLIFDAIGNLYGATPVGGAYGSGTVFKLAPNGDRRWTETVLWSFSCDGGGGCFPLGGLTIDPSGNLYGTTNNGGVFCNCGTVFKLSSNPNGSWTEIVVHSFNDNGKDGYDPRSSMIFDKMGNLYGTTTGGGVHDIGTVFELTPNGDGSWKERVLHSFDGKDGDAPLAGLTFDIAGNLYGTTFFGGADDNGTVFRLSPNGRGSWAESVLHSFNGGDGNKPQGVAT
jgi:uncharacterized repeat protein (TIGR03803 family)